MSCGKLETAQLVDAQFPHIKKQFQIMHDFPEAIFDITFENKFQAVA